MLPSAARQNQKTLQPIAPAPLAKDHAHSTRDAAIARRAAALRQRAFLRLCRVAEGGPPKRLLLRMASPKLTLVLSGVFLRPQTKSRLYKSAPKAKKRFYTGAGGFLCFFWWFLVRAYKVYRVGRQDGQHRHLTGVVRVAA